VTDLVIFVGIVGLVVVVGILVGMIVAGRIDRILAPRPAALGEVGSPAEAAVATGTDVSPVVAAGSTPETEEENA